MFEEDIKLRRIVDGRLREMHENLSENFDQKPYVLLNLSLDERRAYMLYMIAFNVNRSFPEGPITKETI